MVYKKNHIVAYVVCPMLVPWVWLLFCIETLHLLGYLMTAALLKDTAKGMLYNATVFW